MDNATRSLGELPAPFRNSHFARIVQPVAAEREGMMIRGVWPMVDSMPVPIGGRDGVWLFDFVSGGAWDVDLDGRYV